VPRGSAAVGSEGPRRPGGGQGIQDGLEHGGAPRGQIPPQEAGAVQGGVEPDAAVQVSVVGVVGVGAGGAGADPLAEKLQRELSHIL
jgi:hypothetical protein